MEFEFKYGSLKAMGLSKGDVVVCTYSDSPFISVGKEYCVHDGLHAEVEPVILSNEGYKLDGHCFLVKFKPIKVGQPSIDPVVAVKRLESVMEYVNKKLDFLNSNGVQSFHLNEVKRLMNGE